MKRYILTGTPGSGKTSIIQELANQGFKTVAEAATDIISQKQMAGIETPWDNECFINDIVELQKKRQLDLKDSNDPIQFYDRSPLCTFALANYLNFHPSSKLLVEIKRIRDEKIYEKRVFFIENLGFIQNTEARRISYIQSLRFEKIHEDVYTQFGFEVFKIPKLSLNERVKIIIDNIF